MKRLVLIFVLILSCNLPIFSQKLEKPELLGTWIGGEDPSEFLYHMVLETSLGYLKKNPNGKLIVRICSSDDFSTAFIKAPLNPLVIEGYNFYHLLTPEKIFIARFSDCLFENKYVVNQYWFVPEKNTLEYNEIFPVNNISYKGFSVEDYELGNNGYTKKSKKRKEKEFSENIANFVRELKNNSKTLGFIVHSSKSKKAKRNTEKVITLLEKENISSDRVKTVVKTRLENNSSGKLIMIEDDGNHFPALVTITVKELKNMSEKK